jgi:hypothetical protein
MMNPSKRIAARYLYAKGVKDLLKGLLDLDALAENIEKVVNTFGMHFKMGATMDPSVKSQLEALKKARAGLVQARAVVTALQETTKLYPEDKTVQRALKDADVMTRRFGKLAEKARKMITTASKKNLPPALKKLAAAVAKGLKAKLVDPSQLTVTPWQSTRMNYDNGVEGVEYRVDFRVVTTVSDEYNEGRPRNLYLGVVLLQPTTSTKGPQYSKMDNRGSPWGGGTIVTSPKQVVDVFLEAGKGWKGIKGEESALQKRMPYAKAVANALQRALKGMGSWDVRDVQISKDGLRVNGEYRSSLPKEGERAVGEYEYERMVDDEIRSYRKVLDPLLKPYMKHIKRVTVQDEEKSRIYTHIEMK